MFRSLFKIASRFLFGIGICLVVVVPVTALVGLIAMAIMPGCKGGSSGPAFGCHLFGLNFNWLVQMGITAFVGAFITVPIGVLVLLLGVIASWIGGSGNDDA